MDEQRLDDLLESVYNSSDVSWNTSREQCTIEMDGERGSGRSVLAVRHDDDDDDDDDYQKFGLTRPQYIVLFFQYRVLILFFFFFFFFGP